MKHHVLVFPSTITPEGWLAFRKELDLLEERGYYGYTYFPPLRIMRKHDMVGSFWYRLPLSKEPVQDLSIYGVKSVIQDNSLMVDVSVYRMERADQYIYPLDVVPKALRHLKRNSCMAIATDKWQNKGQTVGFARRIGNLYLVARMQTEDTWPFYICDNLKDAIISWQGKREADVILDGFWPAVDACGHDIPFD